MPDFQPYIITDKNASGRMLQPLPAKQKLFQEEWLQELLYKHPSILPVAELDEVYSPLISIGREIGAIDNLFISPSGFLTIVETKLWRNPEAHRTVVAQILEYARNLADWSYDTLDQEVRKYTAKRLDQPKSIYQLVKARKQALEMAEIEFAQRVQDGMSKGRFALLIVGDRIYPAATQLGEVIQSAPHLQFTLGFVELLCFKLEKDIEWPLLVFPRLVSQTKEITRAVVKVIYEEKKPYVEVSTPLEEKSRAGSTSLPEFIASLPSNLADIFRSYIEKWVRAGYTLYWGKIGFSMRIPWNGKPFTVFDAYPDSISVIQEKRVEPHGLPIKPYENYRAAILESPVLASTLAAGKRYIYYDQMSEEDVKHLLSATDSLAKEWFESNKANL